MFGLMISGRPGVQEVGAGVAEKNPVLGIGCSGKGPWETCTPLNLHLRRRTAS